MHKMRIFLFFCVGILFLILVQMKTVFAQESIQAVSSSETSSSDRLSRKPASKTSAEKKEEKAARIAEEREAQRAAVRRATSEITPTMVQNAISGGVEYLKSTQNYNGSWNEQEIHIGGISALCTLALLSAGESPEDVKVARALEYLRSVDPTSGPVESTYVASLQTMVFCMADPKKYAGLIRRNVTWLIKTQKEKGTKFGSWGYPYGDGDPSNSQFALLSLYEADLLGLQIPEDVWGDACRYWEKIQNMDGSWSYYYFPPEMGRQTPGSGSMTCAGIVSLLIAAEKSQLADARIEGEEFLPCQRQENDLTKRMKQAREWMAKHFSVSRNPGNKDWTLYYLYGLERMGRMTEQRFIGGHDWYREGTAQLLRLSKTAAREDRLLVYWEGASSSEKIKPIATALSLLFLSKGRYPVLMTKLQYTTKSEDWNWHRHDISHLARFVERKWKKHVTTQSVDLAEASVEDLLLSPVLYLCGKDSPCPTDPVLQREFAQKLRDYIDRGGFIVAEPLSSDGTFEAGFQQLLKLIFPENEHRLYPMPPEHPIWNAEVAISPKHVRPVFCLDYGCRTCLVYLPARKNPQPSLSCLWELAPEMRQGALHSVGVKQKILAGMNLGLNILAYATDRKLKNKEESFGSSLNQELEDSENAELQPMRGKLAAANLRHGGGCEMAPQALRNLLQKAGTALNIPSGVLEETISITSPRLFEFPLVFMQGRYDFRFTEAERKQLRLYFDRGGILFVNSICASDAFDESFRAEITTIFPDAILEEIPLSDPLCSTHLGGYDLSKIQSRPEKERSAQALRLMGVRRNGRWIVVYSPLDLSCALEQHPSAGCRGYSPNDAAKIGINVILYSMQ